MNPADTAAAYHKWRYYHPNSTDDVQAAFEGGYKAGNQAMLARSAAWVGLEPLLADLLVAINELRIARELDSLDGGPEREATASSVYWSTHDEQEPLPL